MHPCPESVQDSKDTCGEATGIVVKMPTSHFGVPGFKSGSRSNSSCLLMCTPRGRQVSTQIFGSLALTWDIGFSLATAGIYLRSKPAVGRSLSPSLSFCLLNKLNIK